MWLSKTQEGRLAGGQAEAWPGTLGDRVQAPAVVAKALTRLDTHAGHSLPPLECVLARGGLQMANRPSVLEARVTLAVGTFQPVAHPALPSGDPETSRPPPSELTCEGARPGLSEFGVLGTYRPRRQTPPRVRWLGSRR